MNISLHSKDRKQSHNKRLWYKGTNQILSYVCQHRIHIRLFFLAPEFDAISSAIKGTCMDVSNVVLWFSKQTDVITVCFL